MLGEDIALPTRGARRHSLVRAGAATRFALLETIREYALEKLLAEGELDELRDRHARHFLGVAERAWADILAGGEREEPGLALLDDEQENLHAALAWAVENADVDSRRGSPSRSGGTGSCAGVSTRARASSSMRSR